MNRYTNWYTNGYKKRANFTLTPIFVKGGRSVSNRRPPEPQSGALTN